MNQQIFNAVNVERRMLFLLLFSVIIVAGFCIMNTMITVTVQKRREIGVMKAIGARVDQIIWVFLGQGLIVGAVEPPGAPASPSSSSTSATNSSTG